VTFSLTTYNVLAPSYVNPDWYPGVPAAILAPAARLPALVRHVAATGSDVICLQEVEPALLGLLKDELEPDGYVCQFAWKGGDKPDGCATFTRAKTRARVIRYADGRGGRRSGHMALVVELEHEGRPLTIASTHVKWDAPGTRPEELWGLRQIAELLEATGGGPRIICGDLNALPGSEVVRALEAAGLRDAWGESGPATAVANGRARKIDYIFHDASLAARPASLPALADGTPLPSAEEPSDHLAISAVFDLV
jgi:endonuclease/exonuclease/phosphatase family metal-dependent hydrolase